MIMYVHVPFCIRRCNYCAFHSIALGRENDSSSLVNQYVNTLFMELAQYGDQIGKANINSIFFGGGTPSLLPPDMVAQILEKIAKIFTISAKAEISLEANPESISRGNAAANLLAAGINRLSIGFQSLDDGLLRLLGRAHKASDARNAFLAARSAGFTNIGVDLMWALPGQGVRQWLQTLKDVVNLGPDHISTYALTLEPGTPLEAEHEEGKLALPPERDQGIMFMEGSDFLESRGYLHYEISNFARMGFQCRHNMGYWEGEEYLGLGPSATTTLGNMRWTNPANLDAWNALVAQKKIGGQKEFLNPETRLLEQIMLRLRTARGLRLKGYKDMTGRDFLKDYQNLVQAMHENGLVRIRNGYMKLTRSGMLVSNAIIGNIFERVKETLAEKGTQLREIGAKSPVSDPGKVGVKKDTSEILPVNWPREKK